jgi:hypothetical protein
LVIILFRTCELRSFISNISNKKITNISSFFIITDSVENNLDLSSLDSFLSMLILYYDLDLFFIVMYTIEKILFFKVLALIIISLRLLSLSLKIKISIISWNLNF